MRVGLLKLTGVVLLLVAAPIAADAPVDWLAELSLGARWVDVDGFDGMKELEAVPALQLDGARVQGRASVRLRWRDGAVLTALPPQRGNYSQASRPRSLNPRTSAELRELYAQLQTGPVRWRLGKQFINWGTLDGIKVLDVLNPQSFAEFILEDFDDSRISSWGLRVDGALGPVSWDAYWSPDNTAHDLADAGTAYALSASRFGGATMLPWKRSARDTLALRLAAYLGAWELRALAVRGSEQEPVVQADAAGVPHWVLPKRQLLGLQFERSLGPLVIRGEAAWRFDRAFNKRAQLALLDRLDQRTLGFGVDYAAPFGVFVNAQVVHDEVLNASETLVRPARDTIGTLTLRKRFARDRLLLDARAYHTADGDGLVRLALTWSDDRLGDWSVQIDRFSGTALGLFGQFSSADRLALVWRQTL